MKIAVSTTAPSLDADVDPRFGRCQYFVIVVPDSLEFEAIQNTNVAAAGGAGIATAQAIAERGVGVVLTGNCGPNAFQTLAAAGIQVVTGVSGDVRRAIEAFKAGRLQAASQPSAGAHFGMGPGVGRATGGGTGRRMMPVAGFTTQPAGSGQGVELLKQQTRALRQQLEEVERRISSLERKA